MACLQASPASTLLNKEEGRCGGGIDAWVNTLTCHGSLSRNFRGINATKVNEHAKKGLWKLLSKANISDLP
ncbi:MAG: hypothetical protein GX892_14270 [Thermoanaerobacteraceae bacterium]|nr:hypothetical protein [Thermoanaerobacteraceae bacterium]